MRAGDRLAKYEYVQCGLFSWCGSADHVAKNDRSHDGAHARGASRARCSDGHGGKHDQSAAGHLHSPVASQPLAEAFLCFVSFQQLMVLCRPERNLTQTLRVNPAQVCHFHLGKPSSGHLLLSQASSTDEGGWRCCEAMRPQDLENDAGTRFSEAWTCNSLG